MLPGVETRGLNPVAPSASGQKADYRRANSLCLGQPRQPKSSPETSRMLTRSKPSTLSLHLLFRTPFIVEASRLQHPSQALDVTGAFSWHRTVPVSGYV